MPVTPDSIEETAPAQRLSRTRKALIEAGKRMISSGRMEGATIDDIVREADVAKGSFYNHFQDREDLSQHVLSVVKQELQDLIALTTRDAPDTPAHFARGMLTSFRYGLANRVGARVLMDITVGVTDPDSPSNAEIVERLQAGIDEGSLKVDHIDAALVLLMGLSDLGLSRLLELHDERQRARDVMRAICVALLRGLGVDARRIDRVVDDAMRTVIDAPTLAQAPAPAKSTRRAAVKTAQAPSRLAGKRAAR